MKALRSDKRHEEASEVAARRKPLLAAWAVNQLVRTQPAALRALCEAGDDLAQAQALAAAGKGGGNPMRDATHRQRDAVRELLEAAEGLCWSSGTGVQAPGRRSRSTPSPKTSASSPMGNHNKFCIVATAGLRRFAALSSPDAAERQPWQGPADSWERVCGRCLARGQPCPVGHPSGGIHRLSRMGQPPTTSAGLGRRSRHRPVVVRLLRQSRSLVRTALGAAARRIQEGLSA